MIAVTTLLFSRPLTRADLEDTPDDGHRYELIDGVLIVSPGPDLPHQDVVGNLHLLLRAACPPELKVVLAPFDVVLAEDTVLEPDLLVAPRSHFTRRELSGAPLLAVEVLSPSTRRFDRYPALPPAAGPRRAPRRIRSAARAGTQGACTRYSRGKGLRGAWWRAGVRA